MRLGKYLMAAAVATMSVAPVAAANPAAGLSISKSVRSGSVSGKKSDLAGGGGFFVAIIAVVAVIAGIVIVASNDDKPDSK